jgi:predicted RNase H-like nuclease
MSELIAGADGCPAGWICITRNLATGELHSAVYRNARDLIFQQPALHCLAIDIPIGLSSAGPRECDRIARKLLGKRACCVFPAPVRPALHAKTRVQADRAHVSADGRGVGCQSWNLYPKIREVDAILCANPSLRDKVFEVHPEVSFLAWSGGTPGAAIQQPKKTTDGHKARRRLIARHFGARAFDLVRAQYLRRDVQTDDIADAFAALWTAERLGCGAAITFPDPPPVDSYGLKMRMSY